MDSMDARNLLISSISYLKINGLKDQPFYHRKGLHQGDLLSSLLFILTIDSLQMIIRKLGNDLVDLPMAKTTLLQFTDDTAIIMPAHATSQLERLRNLREAFESLNEYHIIVINYE
jgi:Reverse transcriptase (RNA-dependent DNA polymerase)